MVKVKSDKPEQSTLITAVKNVKQKLLTKQLKKAEIKISTETVTPEEKPVVPRTRGIVYLGHIPHGFFESQMQDYFKQFGKVTRVRLVRSKKTGRSRGYGYIEFQHSEVAKIAAESMNNYLMSGRLLKATYIPPEKQHGGYFSGRQWSKQNYPRMTKRAQQNTQKNKNVDNKEEAALLMRGLDKLSNIEKKLEAAGVIYKITPVEVPVPPVVQKRKALADSLPSGEAKKKKIAGEPKTDETKKQIAVTEVTGKKMKTKGTRCISLIQTKEKTITGQPKTEETKKQIAVTEVAGKKMKTKGTRCISLIQTKERTITGQPKTEETKKQIAVAGPAGKKIKTKGTKCISFTQTKEKKKAGLPKTEETKKQIAVAGPAGKKIKTKGTKCI